MLGLGIRVNEVKNAFDLAPIPMESRLHIPMNSMANLTETLIQVATRLSIILSTVVLFTAPPLKGETKLSSIDFGNSVQSEALPKIPEAINIVSGVPMVGLGDESGGFGDVAANLVSAFELKRRLPKTKITFLVTSRASRARPNVMTTDELMKIMLPSLDPSQKNTVQRVDGVDFIFLDINVEDLRSDQISPEISMRLQKTIPKATISIQFSANQHPIRSLLRTNSRLALSFYEPAGIRSFFSSQPAKSFGATENPPEGYSSQIPFIELNAGAEAGGYYLEAQKPGNEKNEGKAVIRHWLNSRFNIPLSPSTQLLLAYSKDVQATRLYAEAVSTIASAKPENDYLLIAKDFHDLEVRPLPKNLRILKSNEFPNSVLRALIKESSLSPLVTGDTSLSLALSYATPSKSFVYEAPDWKLGAAGVLMESVENFSPPTIPMPIDSIILLSWKINQSEARRHEIAQNMAHFLTSSEAQGLMHRWIENQKSQMDIYRNLLGFYSFYRHYQIEWENGLVTDEFAKSVGNLLQEHGRWDRIMREAHENLKNVSKRPVDRLSSSLLLLKFSKSLSESEQLEILTILSTVQDQYKETALLIGAITSRPIFAELVKLAGKDPPKLEAINRLIAQAQEKLPDRFFRKMTCRSVFDSQSR